MPHAHTWPQAYVEDCVACARIGWEHPMMARNLSPQMAFAHFSAAPTKETASWEMKLETRKSSADGSPASGAIHGIPQSSMNSARTKHALAVLTSCATHGSRRCEGLYHRFSRGISGSRFLWRGGAHRGGRLRRRPLGRRRDAHGPAFGDFRRGFIATGHRTQDAIHRNNGAADRKRQDRGGSRPRRWRDGVEQLGLIRLVK